jgi:hypothetical protein
VSAAHTAKGSDWLPPLPSHEDLAQLEPWLPSGIDALLDPSTPGEDPRWGDLRYIVIDELHEQMAGLVLSPWPRVDNRGRLHFGEEEDSHCLAVNADALLGVLRERRIVPVGQDEDLRQALRQRKLIVGDAFAAFVTWLPGDEGSGGGGGTGGGGGGGGGVPRDRGPWPEGPLLDITAEARERAKAQASAAASGVIDEDYLKLIEQESGEDEPPDDTPRGNPRSSDDSGGSGGALPADTHEVSSSTGKRAVSSDSGLTGADELERALTEPARAQPAERHGEDEQVTMDS